MELYNFWLISFRIVFHFPLFYVPRSLSKYESIAFELLRIRLGLWFL